MLEDEVKRPDLVNMQQLYFLASQGIAQETCWVVKANGYCVGALGSLLVPNMFNPDRKTLAEIMWYVLPAYRKSRAGAMLLNAFDKKAQEVADEATMSLLPTSEVSSLGKRGYYVTETLFMKKIGE